MLSNSGVFIHLNLFIYIRQNFWDTSCKALFRWIRLEQRLFFKLVNPGKSRGRRRDYDGHLPIKT